MSVTEHSLQHLPISAPIIGSDGNAEYRFASFFVSFILFLASTVILIVYYLKKNDALFAQGVDKNKADTLPLGILKSDGHTFRLFLMLFSAEEVIIDSTRYDASHLFFTGEQFQHILLQRPVVDRLEIVEIVAPIGKFRGLDTVYKVVVSTEGNRVQTAGFQLDAQSFADGALA